MHNSQLNELKSGRKNGIEVTLNLSSKLIGGNSNDETNYPHKLLTDTQVLKICKAFANGSLANLKLPKTQLSKMQSGWFLGFLLEADKKEVVVKILFLKKEDFWNFLGH